MANGQMLLRELFKVNEQLTAILAGSTKSKEFSLDTDHKRLMAVFLAKACKTHDAIVLLVGKGFGEDAAILTRSLLNLAINVRWINQAPDERVAAYIDFEHVLKARLNRKIVETPRLLGHAQQQLPEYEKQQAELDLAKRDATGRHGYNRHGWSGRSLRDMAKELGMTADYDSGYALTSELEHTSVGALNDYASLSSEGAFHVSGNPSMNWVCESLGMAHLSLIAIAKAVDGTLELRINDELVALDTKVLALSGARRLPTPAE